METPHRRAPSDLTKRETPDKFRSDGIRKTALANTFEKFSLGIRPELQRLMVDRMAGNDALVTRCLNDPDFQEIVFSGLLRDIFDAIEAHAHPITSTAGSLV